MRILLVEDDPHMAQAVARVLEAQGHAVEISTDGLDGEARALFGNFGALIVDRMLPGQDGLSLVRKIRAERVRTPILILTGMSGLDDRVAGLNAGADDYLTKPFANTELIARLLAITRRAEMHDLAPALLKTPELEMDLVRRTVARNGRFLDLLPQEFRLLEFLMRNGGRAVTRKMLLEHVWDLHFDPNTNIVETHMSRLRAKMNEGGRSDLIRTLRGTGYVLLVR